jgi:hypothetical protein
MKYNSFLKCIQSWQKTHEYESWVDSDYEDVYKYSGYDTKSMDFLKESLSYINAFKVYPLTKTDGPQRFLTTLELFRAAKKQETTIEAHIPPGDHCDVLGCSRGLLGVVCFYFKLNLTEDKLAELYAKYHGFTIEFKPGYQLISVMPYKPYFHKHPDWYWDKPDDEKCLETTIVRCKCGKGNPKYRPISSISRFDWGDPKDLIMSPEELAAGRAKLAELLPMTHFKKLAPANTDPDYDKIPY